MSMREIKLPADVMPIGELVAESFQYPENEAWSVQTEEKEQLLETVANLRRLWPLIRLIQAVSPPLRDMFRGHVWEEDGRIVGLTLVQRRGATDVWVVGTVAVRPGYRRRGIARQLVGASLDLIREYGGKKAFLGVIDGNLPAYTLYESLGFEHYGGDVVFHAMPEEMPPAPVLPDGYVQVPLGRFDWQPRYELERRIAPDNLVRYEPVDVGRFRQPLMMRALWPLLQLAQGTREEEVVLRTAVEGRIVARGGYSIPTRGKGLNQLRARLDPAHAELAPYLLEFLLHAVARLSPGRRVEMFVSRWMKAVVAAAEGAGFERRMEYCRMGIAL
jgi:ribosomal protein S18 acetylase RimI-like enzyme